MSLLSLPSLLHLDSSAHRGPESVTRRLTAVFAERWQARHRAGSYHRRDLATHPVPPIGQAYCELGRRVERCGLVSAPPVDVLVRTAAEQHEWDLTRPLVSELIRCDVLLIGAPMYNYAAPAALKAWIDRISFPGAFTDPADGSALLARLRVAVVTACGGAYGLGTGAELRDFLTPYLRAYFTRQGVLPGNIEIVTADMTLAALVPGREHQRPAAAAALDRARDRVLELAESW